MKIKSRNDILNDVIKSGKKNPTGWNAVFGNDNKNLSRDCYIFHPKTGIFLIKEYNKNPYHIKGVGGKIARQVDEQIVNDISKPTSDFGILQGDLNKIIKNLNDGIKPDKMLKSAVKGKNEYGLSLPVRGNASNKKKSFDNIRNELETKQKKIDKKFKEIAEKDKIYDSYI